MKATAKTTYKLEIPGDEAASLFSTLDEVLGTDEWQDTQILWDLRNALKDARV